MAAFSVKFLLVACLVAVTFEPALAQRNNLQPKDFEPLTSLPWVDNEKATLEQVIDRIFREPNIDIRYPVLGEYLRQIPVKDLGRAFDIATFLEGTQTPDELVYFFLYIWAKRDPVAAWEKTRDLFEMIGFENSWLAHDTWDAPIEVQNRDAIQQSSFWLQRETLVGFAEGADDSEAPEAERVELLRAFAARWFGQFRCWPRVRGNHTDTYLGRNEYDGRNVIGVFSQTPSMLDASRTDEPRHVYEACCDLLWRRWLVSHPDGMDKVIQSIQSTAWPAEPWHNIREEPAQISPELLRVWSRVNPAAFKAWISETHTEPHLIEAATTARCMIMDEVPPAQRKAWIDQMLRGKESLGNLETLAAWQPRLAMESAILVKDEFALASLVDSIAYGHWHSRAWNATHSGFSYLKEHGLEHLAQPLRKKLLQGWLDCTFMEQWGDLDVGEAARFGVNLLLTDLQASRKDLLATFCGSTPPQLDDGIWDRTFCALRVWAVVRPTEMKKWIATQEGEDLRSALTWLLEHPWGGSKAKP